MAGNDTAALVVALSAQVTKFEKDMQKAGSIADRQVSSIEDRFAQLNPSFSGLTALIPVAVVTGALAAIKGVVDALAEVGDKAQDMRLPAQELQALSMGAQQARVTADELNKALTTFTDVSKKSADDGKDFYKALQNIGGGFVEAFKNAPSQSERLRILSQAMGSTTDEVKRAQLGLTAFGSDSERVTGYIAGLAGSMGDLIQQARDLGISIDDAMVKQAQTASTQLGTLAQVVKAELTTAIASLIPTIVELLPYLEKIGAAVRDSIASFVSPEARPTATLEAEIEDSISAVKRLQKEQADLEQQGKSNGESILAPFLTDNKAQVAAIQEKIDKEKEFQALRNKILDARQDTEESKAAPKTEPAFRPRPKLNPDAEKSDSFDRTEEQITRRTASMNADTIAVFQNNAAQAQLRAEFQLLNAIRKDEGEVTQAQIDQYEKLRASMSAEQALKEAAINLTPAHKASFISAAEGARVATENYDKARESLNKINAGSAQIGSALSTAFADAVVEGKSLNDVMGSLLKTLAKMAINSTFQSLFNAPSSGGLSPFASLFSGIGSNAQGTDNWRGGPTWVGENGPEIVNLPRGSQVVPNDVATQSSAINAPVNISIDARGADSAVEARLNNQIAALKASLPGVIVSTVKTARTQRSL